MEPQPEPEVTSISLSAYFRLLRLNQNFRRLWGAQIVSEIGDWFYALAVYSLILELTGSAKLVGLAVLVQVLPQTLAAPTAGVVNDRMSRKRVMIIADLARVAIVLGMLLVRSREMVWLIYPLLFLETIGWGFFEPGHSAVIPAITGPDDAIVANTLTANTWSFCLAIGSAAKGLQLKANAVVFGEVGLSGEVRSIPYAEKRLAEAKKLGFDLAIGPTIKGKQPLSILHSVSNVRDALNNFLEE